jgi:hypothetical protein
LTFLIEARQRSSNQAVRVVHKKGEIFQVSSPLVTHRRVLFKLHHLARVLLLGSMAICGAEVFDVAEQHAVAQPAFESQHILYRKTCEGRRV